jgi:hypothetical protein
VAQCIQPQLVVGPGLRPQGKRGRKLHGGDGPRGTRAQVCPQVPGATSKRAWSPSCCREHTTEACPQEDPCVGSSLGHHSPKEACDESPTNVSVRSAVTPPPTRPQTYRRLFRRQSIEAKNEAAVLVLGAPASWEQRSSRFSFVLPPVLPLRSSSCPPFCLRSCLESQPI